MPGILYGNRTPVPNPSQSGTIRIPNHSGLPRTSGFPGIQDFSVLKPRKSQANQNEQVILQLIISWTKQTNDSLRSISVILMK